MTNWFPRKRLMILMMARMWLSHITEALRAVEELRRLAEAAASVPPLRTVKKLFPNKRAIVGPLIRNI